MLYISPNRLHQRIVWSPHIELVMRQIYAVLPNNIISAVARSSNKAHKQQGLLYCVNKKMYTA